MTSGLRAVGTLGAPTRRGTAWRHACGAKTSEVSRPEAAGGDGGGSSPIPRMRETFMKRGPTDRRPTRGVDDLRRGPPEIQLTAGESTA